MLTGVASFGAARLFGDPLPFAAAGDLFFVTYLSLSAALIIRQTREDLAQRAKEEDEGIAIVVLITLAAIGFNAFDIFTALNQAHPGGLVLLSALMGAPLGWAMLHAIYAHHYADLHYFGSSRADDAVPALKFPATERPGPSDFLYFSFVVGMTAQVSDVMIQTSGMRRAVLFHSIV